MSQRGGAATKRHLKTQRSQRRKGQKAPHGDECLDEWFSSSGAGPCRNNCECREKSASARGFGVIALPILAAYRLADWESADLQRPEGSLCRLLRLNPPGAPCGKSGIDEGRTVGARRSVLRHVSFVTNGYACAERWTKFNFVNKCVPMSNMGTRKREKSLRKGGCANGEGCDPPSFG